MNFLRRSGPQMALARASKLAAGSAPCATRTYLAVPTSSFRTAQPPIQSSFRAFSSVTEDSWAAERLGVVGEKVAPGTGMPREVPEGLVNEPTAKTTKLAQDILELNMLEVNQLMRVIQRRLELPNEFMYGNMGGEGSSLPAGGGGSAGGAAEPVVVVVKDAFDIKLTEFDPKSKIKVIKEVRAITGLGLKEAKEMVEGAPIVVKQGLKKDEAEKLIAVLLAAGGKCELV
mmetsp:Transcript_377/g.765  ORF Transcript_377/g.765 Transcript_377/m.765 type:complete len:230 (-) Transcript_377:78-767(-)